jgi:hypothetical protein
VSHANLIVHPESPFIWLLQDQKDGKPYQLLGYASPGDNNVPDCGRIRLLLDEFNLLEGLNIVEYTQGATTSSDNNIQNAVGSPEVISRINTADTLLDYRPCKPKDFVGRVKMQKELWDFLDNVREGKTETRILSITGASGLGKSSLIAKLAERFKNRSWKNKIFLFPVDVRTAKGPLFVAEALLQAVIAAKKEKFVDFNSIPTISDADNILLSPMIKGIFRNLQENNKVLVLFFDQFEELFTKNELLPVFRVFKKFALEVNSEKTGLVVGFSWRTGISLSDENPAYQLWQELSDFRLTKKLTEFDYSESSKVISQFESLLKGKLLPPLKRRLLEQSQGLPWLLKKLCIHVVNQIENGASQNELLGSQLKVDSLFNEDLDSLSEKQLSCLKYISKNSPADSMEVYERYTDDIVSSLSNKRIVIRTGQRFSVYWDIFRDFLNNGVVPPIPWTYIPNSSLRMSLKAIKVLFGAGEMSTQDLAEALGYSQATIFNIITDLNSIVVCQKTSDGKYFISKDLTWETLPEKIRSQFLEHVVYQKLIQKKREGNSLARKEGVEVIRNIYSSSNLKPKTRDNYFNRLIPWFEYSGLVKPNDNGFTIYPMKEFSPCYGVIDFNVESAKRQIFTGAAAPQSTVELFKELHQKGVIPRNTIISKGFRNAAQDLTALKLAQWNTNGLSLNPVAAKQRSAEVAISVAIKHSESIELLIDAISKDNGLSRSAIGEIISRKIGRHWVESSAKRIANGLYRYWEFAKSNGQ